MADELTSIVGAEGIMTAPAATASKNNEEKKAKLREWKESFKATCQSDPDFTGKLHRLSDSLKVVKTLGYGKGGNIIVDKKKTEQSGERVLQATSQIVGYEIQNVGSEPISYQTEKWTKDETGKYVPQIVEEVLQPGASVYLTRAYTTTLCSRPEISFTLANGKIVSSSRKTKGGKEGDLKELLSAYYFSFNKEEGLEVNDDSVKVRIDDNNGEVKPEFVEVFGYLNNPKEARASKGKTGPTFTTQDLAANYINKLLQSNGGIQ